MQPGRPAIEGTWWQAIINASIAPLFEADHFQF